MYRISDDIKEFMESGVAALVGTGDAAGRPHAAYAWAPRVAADHTTVDVFVDAARSERVLANLRANGRIALTMVHPVTYRSVQLKGTFRDSGAASRADRAWVRQRREAFLTVTSLIGDPPAVVRNLWMEDVVRVAFTAERAFDQTPGPEAGKPL